MTKLIPKKDNYMQTSTGKVANFLLPEVEVTAQSPTGNDWEDRNRYKAYKGRKYVSEGRLYTNSLILNIANLSPIGDVMDAIEIGKNINKGSYGQAALNAGLFLLPNVVEKPVRRLVPRKVLSELSLKDVKNWTDKDWDTNYSKAIMEKDNDKVLRLRDLHFKIKAPNTKIIDENGNLKIVYRGDNTNHNILRENHIDEEVGDMQGIYTTFDKKYANNYGHINRYYINSENPLYTKGSWTGVIKENTKNDIINDGYDLVINENFDNTPKILAPIIKKRTENILFNNKRIKSASPITYDDTGNIIPISKRDNFNNPDIRYGLIPLIGFGTYKLYNKENND